MKRAIQAALFMAFVMTTAQIALGSGSIQVTSYSCPPNPQTLGYANLSWSVTSEEPDSVAVWVGGFNPYTTTWAGPCLVAIGRSGQSNADWISYDFQYGWILISGADGSGDGGNELDDAGVYCVH